MRILIELPDEEYYRVKNLPEMDTTIMNRIVRNGIVLPEEHGDLIDRDKLLKYKTVFEDFDGDRMVIIHEESVINAYPVVKANSRR